MLLSSLNPSLHVWYPSLWHLFIYLCVCIYASTKKATIFISLSKTWLAVRELESERARGYRKRKRARKRDERRWTEETKKMMETRLSLTEQSNRVLLDEVLRLQTQLHKAVQTSSDALARERKSRDKLEAELVNIRDSLDNISQRLERVEGTSQLDRNSLIAVVNQARSLEQILIQTNCELRRDQVKATTQWFEMIRNRRIQFIDRSLFPRSSRANESASERTSERSGALKWSAHRGASNWASGASKKKKRCEQMNEQTS